MQSSLPRRTTLARLSLSVVLLSAALVVDGCDRSGNRYANRAYQTAAVKGRAAALAELQAEFTNGRLRLDDALTLALDRLDENQDCTAFAGAVLDLADGVTDESDKAGDYELFWMRVGRLAFKSADMAMSKGRLAEARALVFAKPDRWQTQAYWERYADHDALAAIILANNGEQAEAIRRLRSRVELKPPADEVLRRLEGK